MIFHSFKGLPSINAVQTICDIGEGERVISWSNVTVIFFTVLSVTSTLELKSITKGVDSCSKFAIFASPSQVDVKLEFQVSVLYAVSLKNSPRSSPLSLNIIYPYWYSALHCATMFLFPATTTSISTVT